MRYYYKAKNLKGEEENGVMEAQSRRQLIEALRKKDYFVVSVEGDGKAIKSAKKPFNLQFTFLQKIFGVPLSEKLFFTKNLEVMIRTGVPLPKAFAILAKQMKNKELSDALREISEAIIKGRPLSEAMGLFPKIFSSLYQETLRVGEETGNLEESLSILADQMQREHNLKSRLKGAMVYPIVVLCMAFMIGIFMMVFAVPKLKESFEGLGATLPLTTRSVLALADFLTKRWYLAIVLAVGLVIAFVWAAKSQHGSKTKAFLVLKLPIASKIVKKTNAALALRVISSLLKAGVPIVRTLQIAAGSLGNFYFKESLQKAAKVVEKGKKISAALAPYEDLYSPMVLQMMEVGEETGETSEVLGKLADFYEEEVIAATDRLASVIEPLLILVVGGVVGFFAVSMMQPMFSMMGEIK